jgi:hypothetical protein
LEVKMAIATKGDRRKSIRRQSGRRKGDIEKIKIEGERGKEQEVTIRNEAVPQKKASSLWSWHEEFEERGDVRAVRIARRDVGSKTT